MARWKFPEDRLFNVSDKDGTWVGCTLLAEDEETITITYRDARTGAAMTVQLLREAIVSVSYQVTALDEIERSIERRGS